MISIKRITSQLFTPTPVLESVMLEEVNAVYIRVSPVLKTEQKLNPAWL